MPTPGFVQQQSYAGSSGPQQSGKLSAQDTTGEFDGGQYELITHRNDERGMIDLTGFASTQAATGSRIATIIPF